MNNMSQGSSLPGLIINEITPLIVQELDIEYMHAVGMPYNRLGTQQVP